MMPRDLQAGDVVQIDPKHHKAFGGCLMIVSEPKSWGAQGYVRVPGMGNVYFRCEFEHMEYVGPATWVKSEEG